MCIKSILPTNFKGNLRGDGINNPPPPGPYQTEKNVVLRELRGGGG